MKHMFAYPLIAIWILGFALLGGIEMAGDHPSPSPVVTLKDAPNIPKSLTTPTPDYTVGGGSPNLSSDFPFVSAFDREGCFTLNSAGDVSCPGGVVKLHAVNTATCPYYRSLVNAGQLAPEVVNDPASPCFAR